MSAGPAPSLPINEVFLTFQDFRSPLFILVTDPFLAIVIDLVTSLKGKGSYCLGLIEITPKKRVWVSLASLWWWSLSIADCDLLLTSNLVSHSLGLNDGDVINDSLVEVEILGQSISKGIKRLNAWSLTFRSTSR